VGGEQESVSSQCETGDGNGEDTEAAVGMMNTDETGEAE
jgi:hypothetical protein